MSDNSKYPFEPKQGYKFVDMNNKFMQEAMKVSKELAYDTGINALAPIGLVLVKNGKILVSSVAGSDYHQLHGCERQRLGIANGDYEKCLGCSKETHAERNALRIAKEKNIDINGSDAYLFGHFWYCEPCCEALNNAGVTNYYLLEDSDLYFDRSKPTCKRADFNFFKNLITK